MRLKVSPFPYAIRGCAPHQLKLTLGVTIHTDLESSVGAARERRHLWPLPFGEFKRGASCRHRSLAIKGLPVTYDYSVTAGCTQPLNGRSRVRERVASPGAVINLSRVDSKTSELLSLRGGFQLCACCCLQRAPRGVLHHHERVKGTSQLRAK